jgi:hypothetical protein
VPTVGVAAVTPLEMISRGEDEVGAFVVEVFRAKLFATGFYLLF